MAAGPEFSVIFNPYVNRFLMLLISNRSVPGSNAMQVWEASSLTGPWTKKSGDFTNLPNGQMLGTNYWYFYGPYANEQIMGGEGRTVYYQLSEFNTLDVAPYNVGLWAFDVVPASTPGCKR